MEWVVKLNSRINFRLSAYIVVLYTKKTRTLVKATLPLW